MRKHILLVVLLSLCLGGIKAQDIVILQTGDEMQVKVTKISENEIEYKKWNNLNGPTYIMPVSGIFMIKYENGEKEVYNNSGDTQIKQSNDANDYRTPVDEPMYRDGRNLMIGSHELTEQEIRSIFSGQDIQLYESCQKNISTGNALVTIGWITAGFGIGMVIIGASKINGRSYSYKSSNLMSIGLLVTSAADILLPAGYIVGGIGKGRLSSLAEKYNRGETGQLSLSVHPSLMRTCDNSIAPGIGFALSF